MSQNTCPADMTDENQASFDIVGLVLIFAFGKLKYLIQFSHKQASPSIFLIR